MSESDKLRALVAEFSAEMEAKLLRKAVDGWSGWRQKKFRQRIARMLMDHIERAENDPHQYVDVANLAAFLWFQARSLRGENE